eukprot:1632247-Amphidinium_carterae.1
MTAWDQYIDTMPTAKVTLATIGTLRGAGKVGGRLRKDSSLLTTVLLAPAAEELAVQRVGLWRLSGKLICQSLFFLARRVEGAKALLVAIQAGFVAPAMVTHPLAEHGMHVDSCNLSPMQRGCGHRWEDEKEEIELSDERGEE